MPLPVLTSPPPAPSRLDSPADFVAKADAYLAWLTTFRNELVSYSAELPSVITGTDFSGTSASNLTIGVGDKVFAAPAGRSWQIGQPLRAANTAAPANYMDGQVKAYNSATGALTVAVTGVGGAGTFAAWTISLLPTGAGFATLAGVEAFTNKTLTGNVLASFTAGGFTITVPATQATTLLGHNTAQTVTNKTIDFGSNAISMTLAQLNAALTDADILTKDGLETASSKTFTAPTINGGSLDGASTVGDTGIVARSVGFRGMPANPKTAAHTFDLPDNGLCVPNTTGGWLIPANAAKPFPVGAVLSGFNDSGATQAVTIGGGDTLRWSGTANTGARTCAAYGSWSAWKKDATTWIIKGDLT